MDPLAGLRRRGEQNLREMDTMISALEDPWHCRMASVVREHARAEIYSQLDAIMATLAPDPVYRCYGSRLFPPFEVNTTQEAYALYKTIIDMGYPPAGAFDDQKWYFSDLGIVLQVTPTTIVPGQFLMNNNPGIDPESPYQITYRLMVTHGFDRRVGLMQGEIVHFGDTLDIRKLDSKIAPMPTVSQMVDRLREAAKEPRPFAEVLGGYFAREVYVAHVPPMASDGPKKGADVALLHRSETDIWMSKIPDYHHEDVGVWSEGDEIHATLKLAGTISGKQFKVPTHFRMKVMDGLIFYSELEADLKASVPMMELIMQADMPVEVIWNPFERKS